MSDVYDNEAALARIAAAEERIRTTPPRWLDGFRVQQTDLPGVEFDGHGEPLNKVFQIRCSCGHHRFITLGHQLTNRGHAIFVSPLALRCSKCDKTTELIDTKEHGYDAELGHGSSTIRGTAERTPYACGTCGVKPMTALARFEHSSETLEDSTGEFTGKEQDLFTWFSLVGNCDGCNNLLRVADYECA